MLEGMEIAIALLGGCGVPEPGKVACLLAMGVSSLRKYMALMLLLEPLLFIVSILSEKKTRKEETIC